jgi:alpha-tubulin suppressor-like RCC1 family protein
MNNQNYALRRHSFLRLFLVGLLLSATLAVSVASRATVVKADTGEAAYGTPTQALQAAMSLGSRHTCVIKNGNLLCWGDNTLGQLGNGSFGDSTNERPTYVVDSQD